jgi:sterol desaturase/sphingolipid hydroxylase (fatty acid hydroxylase superfamily)
MVRLTMNWGELLVALSGIDERIIFVVGTWAVHFSVFWGWNLLLTICYKYNLFPEKRIQGGKSPTPELTKACVIHLLTNHIVVQPIALYFLYDAFRFCGTTVRGPLPSAYIVLRDLAVAAVVNDTLFYWGHRMLHHRLIYQYIHKQHHEFKVTIGIACEYAHPVEDVISNLIPTLSGCLFMGSHILVFWLWLAIALTFTIDAHSGYYFSISPFNKFPFQVGSNRHDYHHSHNVGCYGAAFTFWDSIMGTDKSFLEYERKLLAGGKNATDEIDKIK